MVKRQGAARTIIRKGAEDKDKKERKKNLVGGKHRDLHWEAETT